MKLSMKFTERVKANSLKLILSFLLLNMGAITCFQSNAVWGNNLKTMFLNNSAIIYTINIRTFGAQDYNGNDIIEPELGEVKGTFINAIPKLKALRQSGINTVYLLPITKVGKLKAHGTAGSLYALDSFDTINPQFFDEGDLTPDIKKQAAKFVDEAHKLNMHVIVDLPACGSYDLSLEKPSLFVKNKQNKTIYPMDWTDVRAFSAYEGGSEKINQALLSEHKKFIDLVQEIGVDGIRVDVAAIKPDSFWKEVIEYAKKYDKEFLFLAEAAPEWTNPTDGECDYASITSLLEAGFDAYYADWGKLYEVKTNDEFFKKINRDAKILKYFDDKKALMAAFATHDQESPMKRGQGYWQMVNWLNVLLPLNPYVLDGFPAGDVYNYKFRNKKAIYSETDSDNYMSENGKFDIKNFARAPLAIDSQYLIPDFTEAMKFRYIMAPIITSREINELKTDNTSVFAFKKQKGDDILVVIGNLDGENSKIANVKMSGVTKDTFIMPFKMSTAPVVKNGKIEVKLKPYEIQIYILRRASSNK